jgi:molybdopterin-containing oxidoreductase family membrane subunit
MASDNQLTYRAINRDVLATLSPPKKGYWITVLVLAAIFGIGMLCWLYQIFVGIGVAGISHPVGWGTYIVTFVFWVGIAHSGTLISAILYLFRARWRMAIYRAAEAMTVFAVLTAGLFPLIHLGRVWKFYWLLPYPNSRQLWPNFFSPLVWDVFAVSTYLTVSTMFFYLGLIPDIAAARDRAEAGTWRKKFYSVLALGWCGSSLRWQHYRKAYLLFAAVATPLVVSVHSVVSWDFAMSIVPGWHTTIFAPYFVAGAIHSGLAMVITILVPLRIIFKVKHIITVRHLESMAKLIILTGLIVGYAYAIEFFIAAYSNVIWEKAIFLFRPFGTYWWAFWIMAICNVGVPLLFFFKRIRTSVPWLFVLTILINIGMWFERFVIIVTSLSHEFLPYAWGNYAPSWVELGILLGSFAWFFLLFTLFAKHLPAISMTEVKEIMPPNTSGGAQ